MFFNEIYICYVRNLNLMLVSMISCIIENIVCNNIV